MSFSLSTPVNTALLVYILYQAQCIFFPTNKVPEQIPSEFKSAYSWMPKAHPPTLLFTTYTPRTLEPFDGKDGGRILLAIDGTVFDVTAGRTFYGPGAFMVLVNASMLDALDLVQTACTVTSQVVTHREGWLSNPLKKVCIFQLEARFVLTPYRDADGYRQTA
jgi:predicted heme/steroid binding protein